MCPTMNIIVCPRWFCLNEKTFPWDDRHLIFFLWSGGEGAKVGGTPGGEYCLFFYGFLQGQKEGNCF